MVAEWGVCIAAAIVGILVGYGVGRLSGSVGRGSPVTQGAPAAQDRPTASMGWTRFARNAVLLLPVLHAQVRHVIWRTEQEAVELSTRFENISRRDPALSLDDAGHGSEDVNHIVMALQCQDRTRQQLEHVLGAIHHVQALLLRLLNGDDLKEIGNERELVQHLEASFTMAEERDILSCVLKGEEIVHAKAGRTEPEESVTLF